MMAQRNECSATLSGSLMPATHQPLRLIFFNNPASAKKRMALRPLRFLGVLTDFPLPCDFIAQNCRGLRHIERQRLHRNRDGNLPIQELANPFADSLSFRADHEA